MEDLPLLRWSHLRERRRDKVRKQLWEERTDESRQTCFTKSRGIGRRSNKGREAAEKEYRKHKLEHSETVNVCGGHMKYDSRAFIVFRGCVVGPDSVRGKLRGSG